MTEFLIRHFVSNPENITDEKTRYSYGFLTSITGIVCNLFLFVLKFISGLIMNSISIMSDGFNNLSDCLSCLLTLFGYRLSAKPADKEHPFGHGRMEYIISFVVAIIIFVVTYELFTESIRKIIHPEKVTFNGVLFILLLASVFIKLWMSSFNKKIGTKIDNIAMITTAQDSRNDVFVTLITLFAMIMTAFTDNFPFDGIAGVVLSCFLFWSGVEISKTIITRLLGAPADPQLIEKIQTMILDHPEVLGVHDMIIHDYGPGTRIGSAHAEVDSNMSLVDAHNVVDEAEREIQNKLHVMMTIHVDPIDLNNPKSNAYREEILRVLHRIDPGLSLHDFRMVESSTYDKLLFDVLVPFDSKVTKEEIQKQIDEEMASKEKKVKTVVNYDRDYTGGISQ